MVKVKICGITTPEAAVQAQSAGADALGLVLYEKSSRHVDLQQACEIRREIAPFTACVALLVNADSDYVKRVIEQLRPSLLQFHGDESGDYCEQFNFPYLRAIRMKASLDIAATVDQYPGASGFLFDSWQQGSYGGTGQSFDWQRLPSQRNYPLVLAGGLNVSNVAEAVRSTSPYAVDVSGGVESAPGVKDPQLVEQFIKAAKNP